MAVFLPNMIGDGKEFRILGKNYGVLCLLRLFFFFLREINLLNIYFFLTQCFSLFFIIWPMGHVGILQKEYRQIYE